MQKVCLKSLQEDAADDINRRHFQMQVFLALLGLTKAIDDLLISPHKRILWLPIRATLRGASNEDEQHMFCGEIRKKCLLDTPLI